jgi:hypothetical protein
MDMMVLVVMDGFMIVVVVVYVFMIVVMDVFRVIVTIGLICHGMSLSVVCYCAGAKTLCAT